MLYLREVAAPDTYAMFYRDERHHLYLGTFSLGDVMLNGMIVQHER